MWHKNTVFPTNLWEKWMPVSLVASHPPHRGTMYSQGSNTLFWAAGDTPQEAASEADWGKMKAWLTPCPFPILLCTFLAFNQAPKTLSPLILSRKKWFSSYLTEQLTPKETSYNASFWLHTYKKTTFHAGTVPTVIKTVIKTVAI